jgi:hypothetical protein
MKTATLAAVVALAATACRAPAPSPAPVRAAAASTIDERVPPNSTFANPLDLDYRFALTEPGRREAADPVITLFGDDYYLFASKSGGYWYSPDLREWTLVVPEGLPLEDYAPAVMTLGGRLYFTAHKSKALFTTDDPKGGRWRKVADLDSYADPALFVDDDGRVFLYHGSALNGSIAVVELDPRHDFRVIGGPDTVMTANFADHGWERSGELNLGAPRDGVFRPDPYVEGSWMTKHDGRYYLQYAAPGTIWRTYADGIYTSTSPTSGFTYAPYSPFSYKPSGFIGGAGHSATFQDRAGNYWRVTTMIVSVAHKFERRLGIFPAGFDADGTMRMNSYLGDYPQFLPGVARRPLANNAPGWMLLSGGQPVTASSALEGHAPELAADEEVRTYWSASTGNPGEWLAVDLGAVSRIDALQVNLGEEGMRSRGRQTPLAERWVVEVSDDGEAWRMLVDRSRSTRDAPHAYVQLDTAVWARHVRITNVYTPAGGTFSLRGLRVFGRAPGEPPARVDSFTVTRDPRDARSATVRWARVPGARRYVVRFGLAPDRLYESYQVGDVGELTINSLNVGVTYHFTVDALNGSGVARGTVIHEG